MKTICVGMINLMQNQATFTDVRDDPQENNPKQHKRVVLLQGRKACDQVRSCGIWHAPNSALSD